MNHKFKMSLNDRCLSEGFSERFKSLHKHTFQLREDVFHPDGESRKFVHVHTKDGEYWADAVTGSLYDMKTGRCLTGRACIKV